MFHYGHQRKRARTVRGLMVVLLRSQDRSLPVLALCERGGRVAIRDSVRIEQ